MNQAALEQSRHLVSTTNKAQVGHQHLAAILSNVERQTGKYLSTTRFMSKLRKLNKSLVAVDTVDPKTALLYLDIPGNKRLKLMPMENSMRVPEWSIMSTKKQFDLALGRDVDVPWNEETRGWRTVLLRLIRLGIITKEATEREFGVGQRASWRNLTGSGNTAEGIL